MQKVMFSVIILNLFLLGWLKLNLTLLLGRWTVLVAVISVDAYPRFGN